MFGSLNLSSITNPPSESIVSAATYKHNIWVGIAACFAWKQNFIGFQRCSCWEKTMKSPSQLDLPAAGETSGSGGKPTPLQAKVNLKREAGSWWGDIQGSHETVNSKASAEYFDWGWSLWKSKASKTSWKCSVFMAATCKLCSSDNLNFLNWPTHNHQYWHK